MKSFARYLLFGVLYSMFATSGDTQTLYQHKLRVAAYKGLYVTNGEIDQILADANRIMRSSAYPWDVGCGGVELIREGDVIQLDNYTFYTGTYQQLAQKLKSVAPAANALVVSAIDCDGIEAAGCGLVGSEPLIVGQFPGFDSQLWLHERGHNVGLQHSAEAPITDTDTSVPQGVRMQFMFWQLGIGHVGKTAEECVHFENAKLASIVVEKLPRYDATVLGLPVAAGVPRAQNMTEMQAAARIKPAASAAHLTPQAFEIVGAPWTEGAPLEEIKNLTVADLDTIRALLRGAPNEYWPQAISVIALVGTKDDAPLIIAATKLPSAAIAPGTPPSPDAIQRYRNDLRIKLVATRALGILANRTQSSDAVQTLINLASVPAATVAIGPDASHILSKAALSGLAYSNTPQSKTFVLYILKAQSTKGVKSTLIAPLAPSEASRIRKTLMDAEHLPIESMISNPK